MAVQEIITNFAPSKLKQKNNKDMIYSITKKKEKEYHALIDTLLSQLKNKTIIVLDSFYIYVFMDWQWTFDYTKNLFQFKQPNNNFVKFVRIDTDTYETYFSSSANFKIREYWEVQEIQEFVNNTVMFTEKMMVKLVEPHKILHEYIATVYDISCDIFHFTDGFAFKSIAKAAIFLKNVRLCTDMTSFFVRVLPYYEKNKKHIFNLIKMEVQRIEKEKLEEKNPFPL